ncbi:MAG: nucleotidyltransferase family protein [Candidatus Hodarchaeales archaeon]|jgi:molybdenum cofactor cytidylyltransferase
MITCIVLAAGKSTRFPGNKLLFEIKPQITVIEILLQSILVSKVDQTIVVIGHDADQITERIQRLKERSISTIFNPDYSLGGMSSSIRKGITQALNSHAVLITPADIPCIPPKVYNQLIDCYNSKQNKIIIPVYKRRKGHPILISSELFKQVQMITEKKKGLKEIIERNRDEILFEPTDSKGIVLDIDIHGDLTKLRSLIESY